MANNFSTIVDKIFAQGLMALRENSVTPRLVNADFSTEVADRGDTITIPIPSAATVTDVTPGPTAPAGGDSAPTAAQVQLNRWRKSDMHVTDKQAREIIEQGARSLMLTEHLRALANDVDRYLLGLYKGVYGFAGTAGSTPFASDLTDATAARKVLNNQLAPINPRRMLLNPDAEANALDQRAIQDASFRDGDENSLLTGAIGRVLGFDWFMNQNVRDHTAGGWAADSSPTVANASAGATSITINSLSTSETDHILEGDVFTIAGDDQTYVVTADASSDGSGDATIAISPALQVATSGDPAVTVKASHAANMAFHRDAFALATRPLAPADNFTGGNEFRTGVDPISGLTISLEVSREHMRTKYTWSILYGATLVRPELATRLAG